MTRSSAPGAAVGAADDSARSPKSDGSAPGAARKSDALATPTSPGVDQGDRGAAGCGAPSARPAIAPPTTSLTDETADGAGGSTKSSGASSRRIKLRHDGGAETEGELVYFTGAWACIRIGRAIYRLRLKGQRAGRFSDRGMGPWSVDDETLGRLRRLALADAERRAARLRDGRRP